MMRYRVRFYCDRSQIREVMSWQLLNAAWQAATQSPLDRLVNWTLGNEALLAVDALEVTKILFWHWAEHWFAVSEQLDRAMHQPTDPGPFRSGPAARYRS